MKYIQWTIFLPLIISINNSGNIKWYFDKSFEVQKYMKSHTDGFKNIGTRGSYVQSIKHNMNTKSSTEAKLVRLDDALTQIIWSCYFLKEKKYKIHNNIIYHDNQSTTKIEKNGSQSSIKRIRYINIRYFLLPIGSRSRRNIWNSVPPWTWLGVTSKNHHKYINSIASATSLLVSTRIRFQLTMRL